MVTVIDVPTANSFKSGFNAAFKLQTPVGPNRISCEVLQICQKRGSKTTKT